MVNYYFCLMQFSFCLERVLSALGQRQMDIAYMGFILDVPGFRAHVCVVGKLVLFNSYSYVSDDVLLLYHCGSQL